MASSSSSSDPQQQQQQNGSPSPSSSAEKSPAQEIQPLRLPTIEEIKAQDVWNNCAIRSIASGVMGGGLGVFMGLFFGALENPIAMQELSAKQQFVQTFKQMGSRSISSAKAFAVMGLIFSGVECVIEQARAKHDIGNSLVAGCATGASISAKELDSEMVMTRCLENLDRYNSAAEEPIRDPRASGAIIAPTSSAAPQGARGFDMDTLLSRIKTIVDTYCTLFEERFTAQVMGLHHRMDTLEDEITNMRGYMEIMQAKREPSKTPKRPAKRPWEMPFLE